jgi:hypothetical protein
MRLAGAVGRDEDAAGANGAEELRGVQTVPSRQAGTDGVDEAGVVRMSKEIELMLEQQDRLSPEALAAALDRLTAASLG